MKQIEEIHEDYSSDELDQLLNGITPAEQEQVDYKMKMSAKIYAGLKAKGWKSLDLANILGLKSPSLVSKWLSGTHNFTIDTLVDIQRVLGINLLDVEPDHFKPKLDVNFTVTVKPASISKDIYLPLQRVIDDAGRLQASKIEVRK